MLATAETVMKHIVSQVMFLTDGTAFAFAGAATAFAAAPVLAMGPSVRRAPLAGERRRTAPRIPLSGRDPSAPAREPQ
jgi:hypothetical protein